MQVAFVPFITVDGKKEYLIDNIIAFLIFEEIVFVSSLEQNGGSQAILCVSCNDVFAWGHADAIDLPYNEIVPLYQLYETYGSWAGVIWSCIERGEKPQKAMMKLLKKDGISPKEFDNLENNHYDFFCEKTRREQGSSG